MHNDYRDENRRSCAAATRPVLDAVESLVAYASSPEFSGEPAVIAPSARAAQAPILQAGKDILQVNLFFNIQIY